MIKEWKEISLLGTVILLVSNASQAITYVDLNYWKCVAYDATNKEYGGHSDYQLTSLNRALDACKKQSTVPQTCKTAKESCEMVVNGITTKPTWRCVALDYTATPWPSNLYDKPTDAALAAKAYCQAHSVVPETCYMYTFTCRNLNQRKY